MSPIHYVSDYEDVTGLKREDEATVTAKVIKASTDKPEAEASAVAETKDA